jgi:hypothetical protein
MTPTTSSWRARLQAAEQWNVKQLRIFLKHVAPEAYKRVKKNRRAPLEALVRTIIANHKPSQELEATMTGTAPKVTYLHGRKPDWPTPAVAETP